MKKVISIITIIVICATLQAQNSWCDETSFWFDIQSPKEHVVFNEKELKLHDFYMEVWMCSKSYHLVLDETLNPIRNKKGEYKYKQTLSKTENEFYQTRFKQDKEKYSLRLKDERLKEEEIILKEMEAKKIKENLIIEKQKKVEDSLRIIKEKNINVWLDNSGRPEKVYKVNPKTLIQAENQFENVRLLKVIDENVNFSTANDVDFIQIKSIKPTDVFVQLKYSSEKSLVLLQNKVSGQLYIGKDQVVFYQPDMFDVKSSLFAETKEIKVLNAEDIAIQNRYKNILTTYKQKHARIKAICNKKSYEVRDVYGVARYNTKLFTSADKKEYNELDLWFEKANSTLWSKIKEDELSLNGNNKVMEELLENDTWLNLKVGLEQSQSFEHIYN